MVAARTADPYTELDVIDARAPRTNQAVVGVVALLGVVAGLPWLWGVMAAQLAIGLTLGRRYCLPCLLYFEVIQPRLGEGPLEDSRPPRFANLVGVVFLGGATVGWYAGLQTAGVVLGSIVTALALFSAITGICAGCEMYKLGARVRGIHPGRHATHIEPADIGLSGASETLVSFTHPLCSDCRQWDERLEADGRPVTRVDVRQQPELARKYHVAVVPTVVAVAGDGTVTARLAP